MPNTLTLSKFAPTGVDLAGLFDAIEQGQLSMDAATPNVLGAEGTAVLLIDDTGAEVHVHFTTIDGEVHATGFDYLTPTPNGLEIDVTANFSAPEPLGFASWTAASTDDLYEALLGDTRIDMLGGRGGDAVWGSEFGDRMLLAGGDDSAAGGGGDDRMFGGNGLDLLVGGAADDLLRGGREADMLIAGLGDDTMVGGSGNDILVLDGGSNRAAGGQGSDLFMVSGVHTTASGNPEGVRVEVRDFGADDVLVITGVQTTASGSPEGITLADLENGSLDEFVWRQTGDGVEIMAGDSVVMLSGVEAAQVDLDQILFTEQSVEEAVGLFDSGSGGGSLGGTASGDSVYVVEAPSGYQEVEWTLLGTEIVTYGGDISGFATFGAETSL